MKQGDIVPGVKTVHFCELKWQAWALTSFSHSLRSADVDWLLTEAFSPRKPGVLFLLSPAGSLQDTFEECENTHFALAMVLTPGWDCTYLENPGTLRMKRPPNKSKHPSICLSRIALLKVTDFQRILNHLKKTVPSTSYPVD